MGLLNDLAKAIGTTLNPEGAAIDAYIEELCKHEVHIGYNAKSGFYSDGPTVHEVAAWNEFGTEHTPARPFMRQTYDNYAEEIVKRGQAEFKKELASGSPNAQRTLNVMGVCVKGYIQKEIVEGEFEPNASSTIAKKGSDKPLIDTGQMRQAITYEIK